MPLPLVVILSILSFILVLSLVMLLKNVGGGWNDEHTYNLRNKWRTADPGDEYE